MSNEPDLTLQLVRDAVEELLDLLREHQASEPPTMPRAIADAVQRNLAQLVRELDGSELTVDDKLRNALWLIRGAFRMFGDSREPVDDRSPTVQKMLKLYRILKPYESSRE